MSGARKRYRQPIIVVFPLLPGPSVASRVLCIFGHTNKRFPGERGSLRATMDTRTLDAAIERTRKRKSRTHPEMNMSWKKFNTALCLTVLLDMDAASAAAWCFRKRKWLEEHAVADTGEGALQRSLEDAILSASPSVTWSWVDPDMATLGKKQIQVATDAARDKRLWQWLKNRNATHGTVVSTRDLCEQWHALGATFGGAGIHPPMGAMRSKRGIVRWGTRWRRRCNTKLGVLRTKEPIGLDAKRQKVRRGDIFWYVVVGFFSKKNFQNSEKLRKQGPFSGPCRKGRALLQAT